MADIQAGTIYADGGQVTATNLNAHVNNAVLVPGVISGKPAALSLTGADTTLILQGGLLKKGTISQMQAAIAPDLASYVNRNGSVSMTGELTLSSGSPTGTLSAIPKTYVDTGLATKQASLGFTPVNKAGDTMAGTLTLQADPASAFQAATKQYVDTAVAPKANLAGATFTGPVVLPTGDPTQALQATTKAYVDAQVVAANPSLVPTGAIMAFYRSSPPTGWLECNGQSTAGYPNLVAIGVIATPDLRAKFIRGWDNGRGLDPGRSLGSSQEDELKSHTHQAKGVNLLTGSSNGFWWDETGSVTRTTLATGGSETRPKNIALMYCIKT